MNEKIFSIAATFCNSARETIAALAERKPPADESVALHLSYFREVRDVSHRLAGTSRTLGFEEFSAVLAGIESLTRDVVEEGAFDVTFPEVVEAKVAMAQSMAGALRPEDSRLCRS